MMQLNSQLDPAPARRVRGLGAGGPVTLAAGGSANVTAVAGEFLQVVVQSNGNPVATSYTGGINTYIPLSCPNPCEFIMDGKAGVVTFTWTDGTAQSATVNIVPPAAPAPPPKYVASPVMGRGLIRPGQPIALTPPGTPAPTSTGTKVAVGAAAVAGTSVLALMIVSAVTGWGISRTLDRAYDKITGKKPKR